MPDLPLSDVPLRVIEEICDWARLRRCSLEAAAVELIRLGLHSVREQHRQPPESFDVTDSGRRH